jgi:hypothetical protein
MGRLLLRKNAAKPEKTPTATKSIGRWIFFLFVSITLFLCSSVHGQRRLASPMFLHMNDRMIEPDKYSKLESGSPFYSDEWQKATIILVNETIIDLVPVRINFLTNELHYLDSLGREMVSTQKIKAVLFPQANSDSLVTFISNHALKIPEKETDPGWMQLVVKGKASLLKRYKKTYVEVRPYGSSSPQATITADVQHLLWYNQSLQVIKNTADLKAMLALQEPESKKAKWERENEYVRMVASFNARQQ